MHPLQIELNEIFNKKSFAGAKLSSKCIYTEQCQHFESNSVCAEVSILNLFLLEILHKETNIWRSLRWPEVVSKCQIWHWKSNKNSVPMQCQHNLYFVPPKNTTSLEELFVFWKCPFTWSFIKTLGCALNGINPMHLSHKN